jgi:hypothetical protein
LKEYKCVRARELEKTVDLSRYYVFEFVVVWLLKVFRFCLFFRWLWFPLF